MCVQNSEMVEDRSALLKRMVFEMISFKVLKVVEIFEKLLGKVVVRFVSPFLDEELFLFGNHFDQ